MRTVKLSVPISAADQKVFDLLLDVATHGRLNVTLRVAGGWVRNLLLGLPGKDIDIALDGTDSAGRVMSGECFANAVVDRQKGLGMEARTVGVILANPAQSKHLESATTHIFGQPIDFLALRSESYADSRIPVVTRGTIADDALRRDFTCNALFYNLHTQNVEDFCGGLDDLARRVLRCPLDPMRTLSDDPLRLLRGVRFAHQLAFKIDETIFAAGRTEVVHRALLEKVSRERVGIEIGKALSGPDPVGVMRTLASFGNLQGVVFMAGPMNKNMSSLTGPLMPVVWSDAQWRDAVDMLASMTLVVGEGEDRISAALAAMFSNNNQATLAACVLHSLKLPRRILDNALSSLGAATQLVPILTPLTPDTDIAAHFAARGETRTPRVALYNVIRPLKGSRHVFQTALVVATHTLQRSHDFTVKVWQALERDSNSILECSVWRPVVRGDVLAKQLGVDAKETAKVIEELMHIQTEWPGVTDPEELVRMIRAQRGGF